MLNVSIIDDEKLVVDFFRKTTLETTDVVCTKTASSIEEYLDSPPLFKHHHFLFLDLHLKDEISIAKIPILMEQFPQLEIIIYSNEEEYNYLLSAFKLGAVGYIVKEFNKDNLKSFFSVLAKGGAAISPSMAKKLITAINVEMEKQVMNSDLSHKELEILTYLSEGWTYQFIANNINISVNGVRYHIKKIYKKLNVNSRLDAIKSFQNFSK